MLGALKCRCNDRPDRHRLGWSVLGGAEGFDFSASQTYTIDAFSQYSRKASRLWPARGNDQDGRATLVRRL